MGDLRDMAARAVNALALLVCVLAALVSISNAESGADEIPVTESSMVEELVQMKSADGKGYVQIHAAKVPSSAKVYKTVVGNKSSCQAMCNADKNCKGFKVSTSTGKCSLLSHHAKKMAKKKSKGKKSKGKKSKKGGVKKATKKAKKLAKKAKKAKKALHAKALKHTNKALKKVKAASKASSKASKKGMKKANKAAKKARKVAKKAKKKAAKKAAKGAKKAM